MTIREYIDKNLPNLNWNILPQIFEDEGVELTEEIEKYLKETPGNTNWNVFEGVSGSKSTARVIKLTQYGIIPDCYAEDSPWKPSAGELSEILRSMANKYNEQFQQVEQNSPEQIQLYKDLSQEIDQIIIVYNQHNVKMSYVLEGWSDKTIDQMFNGEIPEETFVVQLDGTTGNYGMAM